MNVYPKVKSVKVIRKRQLEITFDSGAKKIYDCSTLIAKKPFKPLQNDALFKNIHVESGGYGVAWSDEIDLSESELWIHGRSIKK